MAVQPIQQDYSFKGFQAPIVQFHEPSHVYAATVEMAAPSVYTILDFTQAVSEKISWQGAFQIERDGAVSALRFITKNILSVVIERGTTVDWLNNYLSLPLAEPITVKAGQQLYVSFAYRAGGSIPSLQASIKVGDETILINDVQLETTTA